MKNLVSFTPCSLALNALILEFMDFGSGHFVGAIWSKEKFDLSSIREVVFVKNVWPGGWGGLKPNFETPWKSSPTTGLVTNRGQRISIPGPVVRVIWNFPWLGKNNLAPEKRLGDKPNKAPPFEGSGKRTKKHFLCPIRSLSLWGGKPLFFSGGN